MRPASDPLPSLVHRAEKGGPLVAVVLVVLAILATAVGGNAGAFHDGDPERLVVDAVPDAVFGAAVDTDGSRIIVGAPGIDAAYVYSRIDGTWIAEELTPPGGAAAGDFGASVAIDGNRAAVGAPLADGGRGAVVLFERTGEGWGAAQTLPVPEERIRGLGAAVAINDEIIAAGAPRSANRRGAVVVYRSRAPQSPGVPVTLDLAEPNDRFGFSVDVADDLIVAGAPGRNGPGAVFTFAPSGGDGPAELPPPSDPTDLGWSELGHSVATDGTFIAAGAPATSATTDGEFVGQTGAMAVWRSSPAGVWTTISGLPDFGPPVDRLRLGWSVDVEAGQIAVGMLGTLAEVRNALGGAEMVAIVLPGDPEAMLRTTLAVGDTPGFGRSVALGDSLLVVGAPLDDHGRGLRPVSSAADRPRYGSAWVYVIDEPGVGQLAGAP